MEKLIELIFSKNNFIILYNYLFIFQLSSNENSAILLYTQFTDGKTIWRC